MAQKLEESSTGLLYLTHVLLDVRTAVENAGELTDAALQKTHFAGQPTALTNELIKLRQTTLAGADGLDAAALKAQRQGRLVEGIDRLLTRYERMEVECDQRETAEEAARQAAAHLPAAATLDKIFRCETTLERQLYRAMNQLERLQRMRQGELVPAPLTLEVGSDGMSGEK